MLRKIDAMNDRDRVWKFLQLYNNNSDSLAIDPPYLKAWVKSRRKIDKTDDFSFDSVISEYRLNCNSLRYTKQVPSTEIRLANRMFDSIETLGDLRDKYYTVVGDSNFTYVLRKGEPLYHGSKNNSGDPPTRKKFDGIFWCTKNVHTAMKYALTIRSDIYKSIDSIEYDPNLRAEIYEFRAERDLRLLVISKQSIEWLRKNHPILTKYLDRAFTLTPTGFIRNISYLYPNYLFAMYVCNILKFDGFLINRNGSAESEIVLCIAPVKLKLHILPIETLREWYKKMRCKQYLTVSDFLKFYSVAMAWPPK